MSQHWHAYQASLSFSNAACCFYLLPTKQNILLTKCVEGLRSIGKSEDELSVIASKTKEALKLFYIHWYWL